MYKNWKAEQEAGSEQAADKGADCEQGIAEQVVDNPVDAMEVLNEIVKDSGNNSILAKYLRNDCDLAELASRKTKFGAGIADLVRTGHKIPTSKVGIYATDEDSYDVFHDLFTFTCIELYGIPQNNSDEQVSDEGYDMNYDAIKSVRVRSARNFSGYAFPAFITKESRLELEAKVSKVLKDTIDGDYFPLGSLTDEKKAEWRNDHYLFAEVDEYLQVGGFYADWPSGRGIFMSNDRTNIIWVNEEDHVRVIALEAGNDFNAVFKKSFGLLDTLEKTLKTGQHTDFGGLTSCPTNLGTGMRASVHVELPNIIKAKGSAGLKEMCKEMKLDLRGVHGENTGLEGTRFDVSNKRRFGLKPRTAFGDVTNGVKKLLEIDRELA